ncbi:MAG: PAS domain-containing protein [Alphaproteobacteria bacterium]|nr:PAS domain-containing protein [Alphaproteobacteria bacterium]MBL6940409.1 PAS domain-containing protein [Alphaproteobacteria bacterium]MBL7099775.1 PAS domain-containing protein [Alphaproteobacteria bacterium]
MQEGQLAALNALNARAKAAGWGIAASPPKGFEHPRLNDVCALWHDKATRRDMPARADMTARAMKPFMPQMTLIERARDSGKARYRIRLHGSVLARYSGDATGKWLEEVVDAQRVGAFAQIYDTVIALRTPLRILTRYQAPELDYLDGESFVAPLSVPTSGVPLILSVTYTKPRKDDMSFAPSFAPRTA